MMRDRLDAASVCASSASAWSSFAIVVDIAPWRHQHEHEHRARDDDEEAQEDDDGRHTLVAQVALVLARLVHSSNGMGRSSGSITWRVIDSCRTSLALGKVRGVDDASDPWAFLTNLALIKEEMHAKDKNVPRKKCHTANQQQQQHIPAQQVSRCLTSVLTEFKSRQHHSHTGAAHGLVSHLHTEEKDDADNKKGDDNDKNDNSSKQDRDWILFFSAIPHSREALARFVCNHSKSPSIMEEEEDELICHFKRLFDKLCASLGKRNVGVKWLYNSDGSGFQERLCCTLNSVLNDCIEFIDISFNLPMSHFFRCERVLNKQLRTNGCSQISCKSSYDPSNRHKVALEIPKAMLCSEYTSLEDTLEMDSIFISACLFTKGKEGSHFDKLQIVKRMTAEEVLFHIPTGIMDGDMILMPHEEPSKAFAQLMHSAQVENYVYILKCDRKELKNTQYFIVVPLKPFNSIALLKQADLEIGNFLLLDTANINKQKQGLKSRAEIHKHTVEFIGHRDTSSRLSKSGIFPLCFLDSRFESRILPSQQQTMSSPMKKHISISPISKDVQKTKSLLQQSLKSYQLEMRLHNPSMNNNTTNKKASNAFDQIISEETGAHREISFEKLKNIIDQSQLELSMYCQASESLLPPYTVVNKVVSNIFKHFESMQVLDRVLLHCSGLFVNKKVLKAKYEKDASMKKLKIREYLVQIMLRLEVASQSVLYSVASEEFVITKGVKKEVRNMLADIMFQLPAKVVGAGVKELLESVIYPKYAQTLSNSIRELYKSFGIQHEVDKGDFTKKSEFKLEKNKSKYKNLRSLSEVKAHKNLKELQNSPTRKRSYTERENISKMDEKEHISTNQTKSYSSLMRNRSNLRQHTLNLMKKVCIRIRNKPSKTSQQNWNDNASGNKAKDENENEFEVEKTPMKPSIGQMACVMETPFNIAKQEQKSSKQIDSIEKDMNENDTKCNPKSQNSREDNLALRSLFSSLEDAC